MKNNIPARFYRERIKNKYTDKDLWNDYEHAQAHYNFSYVNKSLDVKEREEALDEIIKEMKKRLNEK
jgi:hypothetical protein